MPAAAPSQAAPGAVLEDLARGWFPLIPRAKPRCEPLPCRVARVRDLIRAAAAAHTATESLLRAAQAHNLAALILSDCGLPAQAHELCRRQAHLFTGTGALDLPMAKLALQPVLNLGRLLTREGNGSAAYEHFQSLFQAARARADTETAGVQVRFGTLAGHAGDHQELTQWLWTILLSDGIRALTSAGRWAEARDQAQQHNGIGQRLLDGRQLLVLAHCQNRDYDAAYTTLISAVVPTAWEQAVASCLEGMWRTWSGEPAAGNSADVISRYLSAAPSGEPTLFRVRLCLTAADILGPAQRARQADLAWAAAHEALDGRDAYAAHDVITHVARRGDIPPRLAQSLKETVREAGLRAGTLPAGLMGALISSARNSEARIAQVLKQ